MCLCCLTGCSMLCAPVSIEFIWVKLSMNFSSSWVEWVEGWLWSVWVVLQEGILNKLQSSVESEEQKWLQRVKQAEAETKQVNECTHITQIWRQVKGDISKLIIVTYILNIFHEIGDESVLIQVIAYYHQAGSHDLPIVQKCGVSHWLAGIILCMCPASKRRRYSVMPSLIGWVHTQNDLWFNCILVAVMVIQHIVHFYPRCSHGVWKYFPPVTQ